MYLHRKIEKQIKLAIKQFPVCLITGARQVGKSTLIQNLLKDYEYVTFDDPFIRKAAKDDPELFLSSYKTPLIIDEVQYVPEIFSYIKMRVDKNRHEYGQYVLTGSQVFALMQNVSESLAGRIAIFELYPFSCEEILKEDFFDVEKVFYRMIHGFYPEFFQKKHLEKNLWFGSYVSTYLERDIRNITQIQDLSRFQIFMQLIAIRAGQLLNYSEISKECGISQTSVKNWLSILESTFIIKIIRPYYKNHSKRLVKSPKVFFLDTGLLCYLLGIDSPKRLLGSKEKGHIFENFIVSEVIKRISYQSAHIPLYFYRTAHGIEVDLIVEKGLKTFAYEIKCSKTLHPGMGKGLENFIKDHQVHKAQILSLHEETRVISKNIEAVYWLNLLKD